jgi:glycosyltransferase involved in cell wall biosynthesis
VNMINKGISFVIPAKNEEESIKITLETIDKYANNFVHEVIVINHNSTDLTKPVAESMGAKVFDKVGGTIGSARNLGVSQSKYETIVFLDADISLTQNWQEEMGSVLKKISENPMFVTGSHCVPVADGSWIERYWFSSFSQDKETTHLGTGHLIISRALFDSVNGFDESLSTGEDYDLCQRIKVAGGILENNPKLVVVHRDYPKNIYDFFRRERWHGRGDAQSFRRFCSSKVSIASLIHFILHLVFILIIALKFNIFVILVSAIGLLFIPVLASFYKFKNLKLPVMVVNIFIFYIYFWARFFSIFK